MREIPVLAMLGASVEHLRQRARALSDSVAPGHAAAHVIDSEASVGGGAFPTARIPSIVLAFVDDAAALEARLRLGDPPVIGRLSDERLLIDVRTVLPRDDDALAAALASALRARS